jgi:hypothetical protein
VVTVGGAVTVVVVVVGLVVPVPVAVGLVVPVPTGTVVVPFNDASGAVVSAVVVVVEVEVVVVVAVVVAVVAVGRPEMATVGDFRVTRYPTTPPMAMSAPRPMSAKRRPFPPPLWRCRGGGPGATP